MEVNTICMVIKSEKSVYIHHAFFVLYPAQRQKSVCTRKRSMHINVSLVPASDTTLQKIEFNQIIIKLDNGIETRIKEFRGPIYIVLLTLVV